MTEPIFYSLSLTGIIVLLMLGLAWSACVWIVTEGIRIRLDLVYPYTPRTRTLLTWLPVIGATLGTIALFPWAIDGVSVGQASTMPYNAPTVIVSAVLGLVSGFSTKAAHDHFYPLLSATLGRIASFIGGKQ